MLGSEAIWGSLSLEYEFTCAFRPWRWVGSDFTSFFSGVRKSCLSGEIGLYL